MVVIGHHEPEALTFDTVNADDRTGARIAVESMISTGRRDIHMTSLPPRSDDEFQVYVQREAGYLEAMQAAGLADRAKVWRLRERPDLPGSSPSTPLDARPLPEGLFCWSDIHAVEMLNLARARGIAVPEQIAIVGFDNTPAAGLPLIGLSSIDQKGPELGRIAAAALLSRIDGRTLAEHKLVQPHFVKRSSS